jgi:hypothetical protein
MQSFDYELRKSCLKSLLCSLFLSLIFFVATNKSLAEESHTGSNLMLVSPGIAGHTANLIGDKLNEAKLSNQNNSIDVWLAYDQAIVLMAVDSNMSDENLKKMAIIIGQVLSSKEPSQIKSITAIFYDQANQAKFKKISLDAAQLRAIQNDTCDNIVVMAGERVNTSSPNPSYHKQIAITSPTIKERPTVTISKESQFSYQTERSKVVARIQALQAKRVGIQPFYTELARIDELYKESDLSKASASIARLNNILTEQENQLKAFQPGGAQAKLKGNVSQNAKPFDIVNAPTPTQDLLGGNRAISDYSGTDVDLAKQVIKTIIARELGQDSPLEGPFLLERLRIARRMQELEKSGMKIDGYRYFLRQKIEALVASRDVKRMTELRDNIIYMQQQMGLPELKSGHLPKRIF